MNAVDNNRGCSFKPRGAHDTSGRKSISSTLRAISEKKNINVIRRKIFTSENIKKGEIFTHKNLIPLRSKVGVSVKYWKKYLGKKAKKNYKFLSPILS